MIKSFFHIKDQLKYEIELACHILGYIKRIRNLLGDIPTLQTWYLRRRHKDRIVDFDRLQPESYIKARKRWLESKPDIQLTWGMEIPGHAFMEKVLEYAKIDSNTAILEVGPGYGRLLKAILELKLNFREYYGVDISSQNVEYLRGYFNGIGKTHFINGDIEAIKMDILFDVAISSLTLKHFFPSFEKGLNNISTHLTRNGILVFDLIEGNSAFHEEDGTYIRLYSKSEVKNLLKSSNLQLVSFDKVTHTHGYTRLLVIARKQ